MSRGIPLLTASTAAAGKLNNHRGNEGPAGGSAARQRTVEGEEGEGRERKEDFLKGEKIELGFVTGNIGRRSLQYIYYMYTRTFCRDILVAEEF